jgi:hypothetical protein
MEKKIWVLNYCFEGTDNTNPYACTIAVSDDINKLMSKMQECVNEDCEIDEEDEWNDAKNYDVEYAYGTETLLIHKKIYTLYAKYTIREIEVI